MGKRKIEEVWDGTNFELIPGDAGKRVKARCKLCTRWIQLANGHRMLGHLRKVHSEVLRTQHLPPSLSVELCGPGVSKCDSGFSLTPSSPTAPPDSQPATHPGSLASIWGPKMSSAEVSRSQVLLVYACLCNSWAYHSLQTGPFKAFLRSLRADFVVPKKGTIEILRARLAQDVLQQVLLRPKQAKACVLAFDGWKNHAGTNTIAICAISKAGTFGIRVVETERETSSTWSVELAKVVKMLDGVTILGCIADHAANAHLANLLIKDLASLSTIDDSDSEDADME